LGRNSILIGLKHGDAADIVLLKIWITLRAGWSLEYAFRDMAEKDFNFFIHLLKKDGVKKDGQSFALLFQK
jgi:hypothetical protein